MSSSIANLKTHGIEQMLLLRNTTWLAAKSWMAALIDCQLTTTVALLTLISFNICLDK